MMVVHKADQVRIKSLLTEAISNLCRNGLSFRSEFCVEGLLGITLDNDDIFLINIKETVTMGTEPSSSDRDLCDLTIPSALSCTDANSLLMGANGYNTTLDFSKTGLLSDRTDRPDFQLNALDLNIASGYGNADFEMLFDLSTTPGRKRDLLPMDMSTSFLTQDHDVDQMMSKDGAKEEDIMSDASQSDLCLVKEEGRLQMEPLGGSAASMKQELQMMALDVTSGAVAQAAETMLLNLKVDESLTAADLDTTELDCLPLNLSETQPQDLSQNNKQKSKPVCSICGRKFRSEGGLHKHMDKEHPDEVVVSDDLQAVSLVRDSFSQPLDLTIGRGENDGEMEHELTITEQAPFTCICSKVISDYETYIEHVTMCSKSRLTPCKSCEICGKYFFSNSGYVKHKRLHQGAYKFHCTECHKGFFDRTHMRAHMDSSHNKVRRYECEFCQKSFFWKHHLKRHKSTCEKTKEFSSGTEQQLLTEPHGNSEEEIATKKIKLCLEDDMSDLPLELLNTQTNLISMANGASP